MISKLIKFWTARDLQPTIDVFKTTSKIASQKEAQATGDLIGDKIADKITKVSVINKCLKKDSYLQNKDKKMLMILDYFNNITTEYQKCVWQ